MKVSRWIPKAKAEIVEKILDDALTLEQAAAMVGLDCSVEEVEGWVRRYQAGGILALRVTRRGP